MPPRRVRIPPHPPPNHFRDPRKMVQQSPPPRMETRAVLRLQDGLDALEIWCILPTLCAIGGRPEIASRLILERRGVTIAYDLDRASTEKVIRELQAALRLNSPTAPETT